MSGDLELLPCPFCGGSVHQQGVDNVIKCDSCGVTIGIPLSKKQEEAFEQGLVFDNWDIAHVAKTWNTRVAVTDGQFAQAVHNGRAWEPVRTCENLLDDHPCDFECSKCGFSASTVPEGAADWQTTSWSYCPNCGAKVAEE